MATYQKIEAIKSEGSISAKATGLRQAFGVRCGETISLVGGGGKTALMFALACELAATGKSVITTTTTRILEPSAPETFLILEPDENKMLALLLRELDKHRHITLATERLPLGKLKGVSPELINRLAELRQASYIIVEADGAARKPLKAPNATEPVIPPTTSLVIPVVGIDALACQLIQKDVFRPEIISRLTGLPLGEVVSTDAVATLITHAEGIIKGSPTHARIIPLINKVDLDKGLLKAENLAHKILKKQHPQIERVVLAQMRLPQPVAKIFFSGTKQER
jgi:probable selenium-dependent hydroxylase accessory protein YqeC